MRCEDRFYETYGRDYDGLAFCPYRICPIGAHSDHNFGKITGLAIDKGIHFAYAAKQNGVVEVSSLQFPRRALGISRASRPGKWGTGPITCAAPPRCWSSTTASGWASAG